MAVLTNAEKRLVARRVRKGYNEADSVKLLKEITRSHEGDNLIYALEYNGFAK